MAELDIASGHARDAIARLDRFTRANPASVKAHRLLGAALTASGRTAEAAEEFQEALALAPSRADGHLVVAMALLDAKQEAAARRELDTAVALGSVEALAQLVNLDIAAGAGDSAIARVETQLAKYPTSAARFNLLGQAQVLRGSGSAAEAAFLQAIRRDPALIDARLRLADLYEMTGRPDSAIAQIELVSRTGQETKRAKTLLGIAHQQKGDEAKARQAYEEVLRIDPQSTAAANNLAMLLADKDADAPRALALATVAHQAAPDDAHIADTYAWVLFKNGRAEDALGILKECAAKLPASPAIAYHLGMVARKAGDETLARSSLTKAVSSAMSFPGKEEARQALAQLR
jgi:tetratricopeptide (TPR) repeat protein